MTEEKKQEPIPEKRLFSEARGKYGLIDGSKFFSFDFPVTSTLVENYAAITYMRDQIWRTMEEQKKAEESKQCEEESCCKEEVTPDKE